MMYIPILKTLEVLLGNEQVLSEVMRLIVCAYTVVALLCMFFVGRKTTPKQRWSPEGLL